MGYQNFFATKLFTDIGASDSTITLETVPTTASGRLVLEARNPTQREIIKYTGISGNQITGVLRGQGGTTAKSHIKNSLVEMNATAEDMQEALGVPNDIVTRFTEALSDFIAKGTGILAQTTLLTGSFSDIVYYISGSRYTKTGIANKLYVASKDTYVFINTAGAVTYTDVANNAVAPATPANSILVGKVVTNATTITSVTLLSRGAVTSNNIDFTTLNFGNYSTSEVNTGFTWVDGKAIYKKTVDLGSLPNSSTKNVAHGVTSLDKFISIGGVGVNSSNCIDLTQGNGVYIYTSATHIIITTSIARSTFNGFATLFYTKS